MAAVLQTLRLAIEARDTATLTTLLRRWIERADVGGEPDIATQADPSRIA